MTATPTYPYRKRHQGQHQFDRIDVGNLYVREDCEVLGNFIFGDVATDLLYVKGRLSVGTFATNIAVTQAINYPVGIFGNVATAVSSGTSVMRGLYVRQAVSANVTSGASIYGATLQLKLANTCNIQGGGQTAAVWAYLECADDKTIVNGLQVEALQARIDLGNQTTAQADAAGIAVETGSNAAATISGEYCGIIIRDAQSGGGSKDFAIGLRIKDSVATTGIQLGTCTTGITFSGGCGTMFNATATAAAASTRGIFIGEDSDSAQSAIPLLGAAWATAQGNAIYCDDDGVALVGYTEALTVRMLTTAAVATGDVSTTAIHPDLTLNANYAGSGGLASIWGNTTIKAAKTIDTSAGLGDVGGGSFGLDVAGTLASNTHGCGVSVGLGGSGTKNGITTGFRIRQPTGTVLWDGIMSVPSDGTTLAAMTTTGSNTATMTNSPHTGNPTYWFNFYVGTTKLCMPVWEST